jgi:hypothetical protein
MQTASILQGLIFGGDSVPGLAPWAFLHRPSRASCGEIRPLIAWRPFQSLWISLDQRSFFDSHRQRVWFILMELISDAEVSAEPWSVAAKLPTWLGAERRYQVMGDSSNTCNGHCPAALRAQ